MKLKILRTFSQLNFAILMLLLIALFSILGTIIEQDQNPEYYVKNYSNIFLPNNIVLWKFLLFFGLDHVYKTWWFFTLLFIFGFSLTSCTFTQQFPVLKLARRCNFKIKKEQFKNQEYYATLKKLNFFKCLKTFKIKKYNIFQQKNYTYIYKGILGRFAPIIVHLAMLMILSGNVMASLGSLNCQELMVKGEIFQIQNIINKNYFTKIPEYPIRVNDFWIEYGPKNNIKQFYSDISILNTKGKELIQKTISVNFPLRYKSLTIYQTDWNVIGLRMSQNKTIYQLPLLSLGKAKNIFISWIPNLNLKNNGLIFITNNLKGTFSLYNEKGNFLGTFNIGDKISQYNNLSIIEIISETGLQIRADPGIPLIYFGFAILMISSLISYFSFTQFWLLKLKNTFLIGATSNRAKLNLKIEFLSFIFEKVKIEK